MSIANILVVEDEEIVAASIKKTLTMLGYSVVATVSTGEEALSSIAASRPDLVLMDIILKGKMDGIEAAAQIHALYDIPIIYLTAYSDNATLERAKPTVPYAYLLKPFDERELSTAIELSLYKSHIDYKVKKLDEWFATTVKSLSEGVLATDLTGAITFINPTAEGLTGWKQADALGKQVGEVVRLHYENSDTPAKDLTISDIANGMLSKLNEPLAIVARDGRKLFVEINTVPIQDELGNIGRMALVFQDITERKQIEEALRQSEARFQAFIDNSPALSWLIDAEGVLHYVNKAFASMVGLEKEQIIGKTAFDLFPEEIAEQHKVANLKVFETGEPVKADETYMRWDGSKVYVLSSKFPLHDSSNPVLIGGVAIDITKRVQAEEALLQSEERYRLLAENSLDIISTNLHDGTFQYVSPACHRILGYKPEELVGHSIYDLFHPDEIASLTKAVSQVIDNPGKALTIFRYRHKEGHYVWLEATTQPIYGSSNSKVLYFVSVARDVSERIQAEEALLQSEARYRLLAHNLPNISVIVFDRDMRYLVVEGGALPPNSFSTQLIEGKTLYEVLPPETANKILPYYQAALAGIETTFEDYYDDRVLLVMAVPVRDEKGKITNGMILSQDITNLKRSEQSLANEKERLSVTLSSIGDAVITTDLKGNITLINKVAENLTNSTYTEAIGQPIETVMHLVDEKTHAQRESPLWECLSTGQVVIMQNHTLLVALDGTEYVIMDSCAPIRDQQSNIIGAVMVFRDVTSQLKLEAELQKAAKLESLGVLAGGLAHDFNNLLTGITGYLDLSKYYLENSETLQITELKDFINQAQTATERARELTIQLLTFAKGGRPIKNTVALPQLIEESTRFMLHGTNVKSVFALPQDLLTVTADAGQLGQVFQNLVLNAIQAMPEGGSIIISAANVRLGESTLPEIEAGLYVRLSFQDEGVGIPHDNLLKIFDPYFTTKNSGNGLGLAICHSIIRQHKGHIEVESVLGKGTTFTLYLPAINQQAETVVSHVAAVSKYAQATTPMRILVMDDEQLLRNLVKQFLQRMGHTVEVATEGKEACQLYQAAFEAGHPFDVALLDLTIPGGMGGKQTMTKLLELDPYATGVVCSGYSNDPIMANYMQYGFKEVLPKPYNMGTLARILEKLASEYPRRSSDNVS